MEGLATVAVTRRDVIDLVRVSVPEVHRDAIRLTGGDRALAEELVQDACLALVRTAKDDPDAVLSTGWMIVVARRRYIDHLRRRERETRRLDRITSESLVESSADDPDWSRIEGGDALTCLAALPGDQRAALVFRYVDDLPVAEVAELLDRTVAATESLLARGRRRLAQEVEEARHG